MQLARLLLLLFFLCGFSPVGSPVKPTAFSPVISGAVVAEDPQLIDSVVSSTVFEIDATLADSYSGTGQDVNNVATSPNDGETQGAYDFYLGADGSSGSDDPTFTGLAGYPSAYFAMDGGDLLFIQGGNTTFTNAIHKTTGGSDFWVAVALKNAIVSQTGQVIVGNQDSSADIGVSMNYVGSAQSTRPFRMQQYGTSEVEVDTDLAYPTATTAIVVYSHSHSTNKTRIWVNGYMTEVDHTFNATTSNASADLHIGGHPMDAFLQNGTELYTVAMGNSYLTQDEELDLRRILESRHNRSYTDTTLETFDFTDTNNATLSTLTTSNIVQIHGAAGGINISVSGDGSPEYRVCADSGCSTVVADWDSADSTLTHGSNLQYIQLRMTTNSTYEDVQTVDVTVADQSADWDVTNEAEAAASLQDTMASAVFDIDATVGDSYSGTGTDFLNLVPSPFDGSAKADRFYNYRRDI